MSLLARQKAVIGPSPVRCYRLGAGRKRAGMRGPLTGVRSLSRAAHQTVPQSRQDALPFSRRVASGREEQVCCHRNGSGKPGALAAARGSSNACRLTGFIGRRSLLSEGALRAGGSPYRFGEGQARVLGRGPDQSTPECCPHCTREPHVIGDFDRRTRRAGGAVRPTPARGIGCRRREAVSAPSFLSDCLPRSRMPHARGTGT